MRGSPLTSRRQAHLAAAVGDAVRSFRAGLVPGTRLGPYEIVGLKGEGGMGTVYRARRNDEVFRKDVAIKVVKPEMASGDFLRRFRRERRILARLEHPFIARVLDGGSTDDGLPYLVMEYVEGQNLLDHANKQQLDVRARLRLFCQVCQAVTYAHENQVVHRDLKPSNILVDTDGRPRLLDFGIAKLATADEPGARQDTTLTAGGFGMLTPRYASPEHVKGEPITVCSDVYSLGLILYELLTGCVVHRLTGASPAAVLKAICDAEVRPPSQAVASAQQHGESVPVTPEALAGDLDRVLLKALEKDPQRRYASVEALADDLHRHIEYLPVAARAHQAGGALTFVRRHRPTVTISLLAALAVVPLGVGYYRASDRGSTTLPAGRVMLAALPLKNLTGSEEQEYFIDGLHEEIISRLGRLQPDRLAVIARTSTLQYQQTTKSIATIGGELGAHYILEGSVRQAGERVHVTAQLIQVSDQTQLWAETFERELRDLFSVQVEIGAEVAECLAVDVLPKTLATAARHEHLSPDAHAAYLRGKYYWHRRWLEYPANLQRALDHFEGVVAAAPRYAEGYAALGQAYNHLSLYAAPSEKQDLRQRARAALAEALVLESHLASAVATLALIRFQDDWDWAAAELGFRDALREDPNSADTHQWLATLLAYTGRHEEADHQIRLALELDPLSPSRHAAAFFVHMAGGHADRAHATVRKLAELFPGGSNHIYFASLLLTLREDCKGAREELAKLEPLSVGSGVLYEDGVAGYVLSRCGKAGEGARRVKAMEDRPHHYAYTIAHAYAGLGDRVRALRWLEESHRRREAQMIYVAADPMFQSLRNEYGFQTLLQQMRLPQQ